MSNRQCISRRFKKKEYKEIYFSHIALFLNKTSYKKTKYQQLKENVEQQRNLLCLRWRIAGKTLYMKDYNVI